MQQPLVFITSSTSAPPQGRNARAKARAESAKLTIPCREQKGMFGSFDINFNVHGAPEQEDDPRNRKRKRTVAQPPAKHHSRTSGEMRTLQRLRSHPLSDACLLRAAWMAAVAGDLDDVLAIAAYHIRRSAAQMAAHEPSRLVDALRCRQWSIPPSSIRNMKQSEPIASATALLGIKLRLVLSGRAVGTQASAQSEWAFRSLRIALTSSNDTAKQDLLPAVWLLALSGMLESPNNEQWNAHAAGAAALIKAGALTRYDSNPSGLHFVRPTLVEALLTGEDVMAANAPWQAIIHPVVTQLSCRHRDEVTAYLTTAAALIAEIKQCMKRWTGGRLNQECLTEKLLILHRANEARDDLKQAILAMDLEECPDDDVLGLCLAAMVGLDNLMSTLQPVSLRLGKTHEEDTLELCTQVLEGELKRNDAFPTTKLLQAFKRHGAIAAMSLPY